MDRRSSPRRERVFELSPRLHGGGKYPGAGIGLALVERVVEAHGGRVWVDPEPGAGSTFYFTLPAEPARHVPARA